MKERKAKNMLYFVVAVLGLSIALLVSGLIMSDRAMDAMYVDEFNERNGF